MPVRAPSNELLRLDNEFDLACSRSSSKALSLPFSHIGDSLAAAQLLQEEHIQFEMQAREIQETVLRLLRTADQLVHSAHYDAEGIKKRLQIVDEKCEDFMLRLDVRRKNLALAINFFSLAQSVSGSVTRYQYPLNIIYMYSV